MTEIPKKVLIVEVVEDEPSLRRALVDKCTQAGLAVSEAENGEVGLAKALVEHPDLIVLDLLMPKKDGMQFLTELRADPWGKTAKVIILSNVSEVEKVAEAMGHQAFDYMVKSDTNIDKVTETILARLGVSK